MKIMKKNFVLIAALIAALTVAFVSCGDDGVVSGTGEKTPAVALFGIVDGMTKGIEVQTNLNMGSFDDVNGIIDLTPTAAGQWDGGVLFKFTDLKKAEEDSTITITYVCDLVTGSPAKLTLKDATSGWDNLGAPNSGASSWYIDLKVQEEATIVVKGSWYADPKTGIGFQRGDDRVGFRLKILSVKVE
jgi:ABC-type oligopeptide transport system substrate-binding subunit